MKESRRDYISNNNNYLIIYNNNNNKNMYIISFLKASLAEYASIRIWDTFFWTQVALLTKHTLTVTQLSFSHSGNRLLAVSRDRLWSLWEFDMSSDGKCHYYIYWVLLLSVIHSACYL